ncbi:AI-2E family transporter [Streptococcus entericus]|uniref:AI-2E family transporter n=1 Tax=Streptococcus entericus TaxID=155680 RepID=UPI00035FC04A|nr:AI-2E family transporter [Streptococcus entericus]
MKSDKQSFTLSWFFKWFLNRKSVTILLVSLLFFLNLLVFTKISFLFEPVIGFLTIVMLPLVISALIYYLLDPIVLWLEKQGLSKVWAITITFIGVIILMILGIASIIPMIQAQLGAFFSNLPNYIETVESQVTSLLQDDRFEALRPQLADIVDTVGQKAIEYVQTFSKNAVDWASNFASAIAKVTVAVLIAPFIIFYLLRDGKQLKDKIAAFLPTKMRQPARRVLSDINKQLAGYVQGQVTVAIVVGLMFSVMFSLIGLPYAITFGILAGILNMIPYLGSFLAMVPVVILGLVEGPFMLIKVLLVFVIEQTIEGRFVTPLVLGNKLSIHPITILFVLLTAGSMFGLWGVLLGIPLYASVKVILTEVFNWYKIVSGLYQEEVTDDQ